MSFPDSVQFSALHLRTIFVTSEAGVKTGQAKRGVLSAFFLHFAEFLALKRCIFASFANMRLKNVLLNQVNCQLTYPLLAVFC